MKIAGGVTEYKEALDIEEIVKVFFIKKRIYEILSLEREKNYINYNQNFSKLLTNDINFEQNSNGKSTNLKNGNDQTHIFNVRGLI